MNLKLWILSVVVVLSGTSAEASSTQTPRAEDILFSTVDAQNKTSSFTVASLAHFVRTQYRFDRVMIQGLRSMSAGPGVGANAATGAVIGHTAAMAIGTSQAVRDDQYDVVMTVERGSSSHQVRCRLYFVDKEPEAKVQLKTCKSKTANFDDAEADFKDVGLKKAALAK